MSQFNTTKQKLRKVWEKIFSNKAHLLNIDNKNGLSFFSELSKQQINTNIVEFFNSPFFLATFNNDLLDASFTTKDIDDNTVTTSTKKTTLLPNIYQYEKEVNLPISEEFLPFLKIVPEVKNIPDYTLSLGKKIISSEYNDSSDIIQIRGDGSLLFKSNPSVIDEAGQETNKLLNEFTETELNTFSIPIANTKKVFNIKILYTLGGKDFSIDGRVTDIQAIYDTTFTCNQEKDTYTGNFFEEGVVGSETHDNEILFLTNSTFSFTSKKTELRYVDIPPCTSNVTIIDGVTITDSFTNTTSYSISVYGAWRNITDDIFLGNNQTVTVSTTTATITSQDVTFIGYRPYYDSDKQGILSTKDTGASDGDFDEFELFANNLPNTDNGHILTYTAITFDRSPDTDIFDTDEYIQHSAKQLPVYFNKGNDNFFTTLSGSFILETPALILDINSNEFPVYDDEYTVSGTTYVRTTENHSLITPELFTPEITDAEVQIRIYIKNPLYWKEEKKYEF